MGCVVLLWLNWWGEKIYLPVCIRVLQRKRTNILFYFKEFYFIFRHFILFYAQVIMGVGKFEICRADWQAGNSAKSWCCNLECEFYRAGQVCWNLGQNFCVAAVKLNSFFGKPVFALKASNWLMKFTYKMENNWLYSKLLINCQYQKKKKSPSQWHLA